MGETCISVSQLPVRHPLPASSSTIHHPPHIDQHRMIVHQSPELLDLHSLELRMRHCDDHCIDLHIQSGKRFCAEPLNHFIGKQRIISVHVDLELFEFVHDLLYRR